jgi:hypothetical protein
VTAYRPHLQPDTAGDADFLPLQVRAHQSASADLQSLADQQSQPDLQSDQRAWADLQSDQWAWADLQFDQRARADLWAREQQSQFDLLAQRQGGQLVRADQRAWPEPQVWDSQPNWSFQPPRVDLSAPQHPLTRTDHLIPTKTAEGGHPL